MPTDKENRRETAPPREMDAVVRKYLAEISAAPESNQIRRYRRTKKPRVARTWRTREDPFVEVWPEVRVQLEVNPAQTAKALFIRLQQRHPCRFFDGQLRTLQRRVRDWRREQLYKAEISRVEPTFSEIGSDFAKEGCANKGATSRGQNSLMSHGKCPLTATQQCRLDRWAVHLQQQGLHGPGTTQEGGHLSRPPRGNPIRARPHCVPSRSPRTGQDNSLKPRTTPYLTRWVIFT